MKKALVLILLLAGPAWGRGWEAADPEGACDFAYARYLHQLDCAPLNGAVESQRQVVNQRLYSMYQQGRWMPARPAPAVAPSVAPPQLAPKP